jgi:hypothetical protein
MIKYQIKNNDFKVCNGKHKCKGRIVEEKSIFIIIIVIMRNVT